MQQEMECWWPDIKNWSPVSNSPFLPSTFYVKEKPTLQYNYNMTDQGQSVICFSILNSWRMPVQQIVTRSFINVFSMEAIGYHI